jgi:hypothetical protein
MLKLMTLRSMLPVLVLSLSLQTIEPTLVDPFIYFFCRYHINPYRHPPENNTSNPRETNSDGAHPTEPAQPSPLHPNNNKNKNKKRNERENTDFSRCSTTSEGEGVGLHPPSEPSPEEPNFEAVSEELRTWDKKQGVRAEDLGAR